MSVNVMSGDSEEQKQQQRTFLRERYLRMLASLSGVEASVKMYDKTTVRCLLGASDVDFQHLQVSNLNTPMGVLPNAMLRTKDVISIHIPSVKKPLS
ncbi:gem-associated protein 7-like [Littorina saxatilis]|uniref:Gem-associated protein 7 n=1 Tax=Littorina saxatilis TaxID=31220 RepID=A0AAN9AQN9_9CAEN